MFPSSPQSPDHRQLLVFASVWGVCFAGVAYVLGRPFGMPTEVVLTVAAIGPVLWFVWPTGLRWLYTLAVRVTFPIGWVVSHLVLIVIYFVLVTPLGWLLRAFGYDALKRTRELSAETYWIERRSSGDLESYFRPYRPAHRIAPDDDPTG